MTNPNEAIKELAHLIVEIAQRDTPLDKIIARAKKVVEDIDGKVAHVVEEVKAEAKVVEEKVLGKRKAEPAALAPAPEAAPEAPAADAAPTA